MRGLLLLSFTFASAFSMPQKISPEDVFGDTSSSNRYGVSGDGLVDQSLIDDVFGQGSNIGGYDENGSPLPSTVDGYKADQSKGKTVVDAVVDGSSDKCSYYAAEGYSCVPYYNCEAGEIVTDGGGLIDIRSSFGILDPSSSKCPGYLEVCCKHPDATTTTEKVIIKTPPPPPPPYVPQCGRRNTGGIGVRIQNDKYKGTTQFGEWPHMCAVLEKKIVAYEEEVSLYVCGASLVAPGVVLTAAHCVQKYKPDSLKVRCGEWDTQQEIEPKKHEERNVNVVLLDPQFNPRNLQNDFALLFLSNDFVLQPHIDTICLPDSLQGIYSYDQKNCVATGWGKDKFGKEGEYQVVMKQVQMDIVNNTQCENKLRTTRLGQFFELDDSFMCAGGQKDKDTCKGDGGGPLVCPAKADGYGRPSRYVQAGIVAWGIECGQDGIPGVYASVSSGLCFMDWAAKCATGLPDIFNINGCQNYATELESMLKTELAVAEQRNNKRALRQVASAIENFAKMKKSCAPRVVNIADLARATEQVDGYNDPGQVQVQEPVIADEYTPSGPNGNGQYNDPGQIQVSEPVLVKEYDPSQINDPGQIQVSEPVVAQGGGYKK